MASPCGTAALQVSVARGSMLARSMLLISFVDFDLKSFLSCDFDFDLEYFQTDLLTWGDAGPNSGWFFHDIMLLLQNS